MGGEEACDGLLDGDSRGERVGSFQDWAADDDVIGAGGEGVFDGGDSFLVVGARTTGGADSGRDDQEVVAEFGSQRGDFEAGGDDAVAAERDGALGAGQNQFLYVRLESPAFQVSLVEACEHGDGEQLDGLFFGDGGLQDFVAGGVDGGELHVPASELLHGAADGLRDVEEFQVGKHFFAAL